VSQGLVSIPIFGLPQASLLRDPPGVGGDDGQAVLRAAVLPGLLRDGDFELQDKGRQVLGRKPKQPPDRREAKLVELLEPLLQRVGGKRPPLRRK